MIRYRSTKLPHRFWAKVVKGPDGFHSQTGKNLGPCWLWTGHVDKNGYGNWSIGKRSVRPHRPSYEALVGPITKPMLDHLCRRRSCVNPRHLEPVTALINIRRGNTGQSWATKTHCPSGHPYNEVNTYRPSGGGRKCRACNRLRVYAVSKVHGFNRYRSRG